MPGEPVNGVMGAACTRLRAEQRHGALRTGKQVRHLLHNFGVADEVGRTAVGSAHAIILWVSNLGRLGFAVHDVVRDFQEAGPWSAVIHFAKRDGHHFGGTLGGHHQRCKLADRRHHFRVAQFLQSTHAVLLERGVSADQQHGTLRAERVRHAGDCVGGARPRGNNSTAEARDASVGIGSVRSHLFVADVDNLDAFVDASVVDIDDVPPRYCEDVLDALLL